MAGSLLEAVARARDNRRTAIGKYEDADDALAYAIQQAHRAHTWNEIADVLGLSRARVRQIVYEARKREDAEQPWATTST